MAYYKPQSPIKKGEDYIYPLTTVDQIILDDGTRLNERYVTANLTDMEAGMAPFTDADTLGGVTANEYATKAHVESNYALKTDVAPDSAKLGGLLPENYAVKTDVVMKSGDTMTGGLTVPSLISTGTLTTSSLVSTNDVATPSLLLNGTEIRDLFYPVDSIYVTSTNTSPADRLGGEWTLVNKHFSSARFAHSDFITYNTTNVTGVTSYAQRNGDSITIKLAFKPLTDWDDDTIEIGTLNYAILGVDSLESNVLFLTMSDGGGGLVECQVNSSTGVISAYDTVAVDGGDTIKAEQTQSGYFTVTIGQTYKLDEACNEFIWKRTA